MASAPSPEPSRQPIPTKVDVVIIGGGITGLTAALLLSREGVRLAVLEKGRLAHGETGHTTAHLTELLDEWYLSTEKKFGRQGARLVRDSQRAAIERIAELVMGKGLDCGFERVPAYLYSETDSDLRELDREAEAMRRAGLDAARTDSVPLPFEIRGAIRIENQAQFHPRDYLMPIAEEIRVNGGVICEGTHALEVHEGRPCRVRTLEGDIACDHVIVATNHPMSSRYWIHTKVAPYRTYAVATRGGQFPPPGLYWDTAEPYHYTRTQKTREGEFLIVGGEDHKVGKAKDAASHHARLEAYTRERFGVESIDYAWSGQVIEPADGLPFIGRSPFSSRVLIATGYSGTGITFGTLAGMILSDRVLGRANPYARLYDATRIKPLAQAARFVRENLDFPTHLAMDRLPQPDEGSLKTLPPGEGRVLEVGGKSVAAYRDDSGGLHAVSAVCTHLGCHVRFNDDERSWDCPCHGSRFTPDGEVLNGPAAQALARVDVGDEERAEPRPDEPSHPTA